MSRPSSRKRSHSSDSPQSRKRSRSPPARAQPSRDRPSDRHQDRHQDRHRDRQSERPFDRPLDRPSDRQQDRQPDRQQDRQSERRFDRQQDRSSDRQSDRQPDRPFDRQQNRQQDRPFDRQPKRQQDRPSDRPRPDRSQGAPALDGIRLFVRNLAFDTTKDDIFNAFERVWKLEHVLIPVDRASGQPRGFAYVSLTPPADRKDAERVCAGMQHAMCRNRPMQVEVAVPHVNWAGGRVHTDGGRVHTEGQPPKAEPARALATAAPMTAHDMEERRLFHTTVAAKKAMVADRSAPSTAAEVFTLFEKAGDTFHCENWAAVLHKLGKMSAGAEDARLSRVVRRAASSVYSDPRWTAQLFADSTWGLARIAAGARGSRPERAFLLATTEFFDAVASNAVSKVADFDSTHLAKTAWAFSTAGVSAPALFEAIASEASKKMATFTPQHLTNTAWAFSAAKVDAAELFDEIAAQVRCLIVAPADDAAQFTPQNLANILWAYASAAVEAPALFGDVAEEACQRMAAFEPQELANTAWAFATAGIATPLLFEAVAAEALKKIENFTGQDVSKMVWAFATAGVSAPLLFEAAATESVKKMAALNARDVADIAYAFAISGNEAAALFDALAPSVQAKFGDFGDRELAQCLVVFLHLRTEAPEHALAVMLQGHEAEIRAAHVSKGPSPAMRDVSKALTLVEWDHEVDYVAADGISLATAQPASKVAVEYCGPEEYFAASTDGVRRELGGAALFRDKLLYNVGWTLLRVPFSEWAALESPAQQSTYLADRLAAYR